MDLQENVREYNQLFVDLTAAYRKRGFKDYGLEGEWRRAIHQVESDSGEIKQPAPAAQSAAVAARREGLPLARGKRLCGQRVFETPDAPR